MNNKKLVITFLVIIGMVLFSYPITFILSKKGFVNIAFDNFKVVEKTDNKVLDLINRAKIGIENRVTNYFPFYYSINRFNASINDKLDKTLYNSLNIDYYPVGVDSQNEVILKDNDHFILINVSKKEDLDKRLNEQINFFNEVSSICNTYIYFANRYEFYPFSKVNNINDMVGYYNKFKSSVNAKIGELKVSNKEEYLKYFFKTDHHYNMYGAYASYKDIMTLMNRPYKERNIFKIDGIAYMGSMAKSSYNTSLTDNLYDIEYSKNYNIYVDDSSDLKLYKEHKIKNTNNKFYDHFVAYFNGMYSKVLYDTGNTTKTNLLILGDSFTWKIDNLIAEEYNKTYIINIKYMNGTLDLKEFIKENNISDILVLYETNAVLFDQYNYNFNTKIKR